MAHPSFNATNDGFQVTGHIFPVGFDPLARVPFPGLLVPRSPEDQ